MSLEKAVYLMYSARHLSKSIHARYTTKSINTEFNRAVEARNQQYTDIQRGFRPEGLEEAHVLFKWQRPHFLRVDTVSSFGGVSNFTHRLVNEDSFIYFDPQAKYYILEQAEELRVRFGLNECKPQSAADIEATYANWEVLEYLFIDPRNILRFNELEYLGEDSCANRKVYRVRGYPSCHPFFRGVLDGYLTLADYYNFYIDSEKGILLKYELLFEDTIIESFEMSDVKFDEEINSSEFSDNLTSKYNEIQQQR